MIVADQERASCLIRTSLTWLLLTLLLIASGRHAYAADPPPAGLTDLLSAPLPGTQARDDADLSRRLERALADFDGVDGARVILVRPPNSPEALHHAAVQLTLAHGFIPAPAWLNTVRTFCLRTVPHLEPHALTIVDSTGRTLHEAGEALVPPVPPPTTGVVDETFRFEPWWLWAAAGAGFLLVVAGAVSQRILRRDPGPSAPARSDGPLEFLTALPDERIAAALAEERPELIAAVLSLAPPELAARLRRHGALPHDLPRLSGPLDAATAAALTKALRGRLTLS